MFGVDVKSGCLLKMSSPYFAMKDSNVGVVGENRSISVLISKMARSAKKAQNSDSVIIKEEKEEHNVTSDNNLVAEGSRAGKLADQSLANVTALHPVTLHNHLIKLFQ